MTNIVRYSALLLLNISALLAISGCTEQKKAGNAMSGNIYSIHKTLTAPVMDGILNDDCWSTADAIQLTGNDSDGQSSLPTNVRLLWDDTMLYVGFECRDPDAASTVTMRDGPVSEADYVSIYLDADADTLSYAEILIAPTGAVFDAFVLSSRNGVQTKVMPDWNCENMRISVTVYGGGAKPGTEDRFWTVEAAIPFTELLNAPIIPPREGSVWRIDLYRQDMSGESHFSSLSKRNDPATVDPTQFSRFRFGG